MDRVPVTSWETSIAHMKQINTDDLSTDYDPETMICIRSCLLNVPTAKELFSCTGLHVLRVFRPSQLVAHTLLLVSQQERHAVPF